LTLEKAVKIADELDWGFRFDSMFGYDVDLIHSNGLFDIDTTGTHQRYGYDAPQIYVDVALPVANGVHVLAGKWYTPICYETVNPTTTPFYSHSFLFMFGTPYTHTGLRVDVPLDSEWTLTGAAIRGWEQSTADNNDSLSYYAGATYANAASGTGGSIVVISGPEQPDNDSDYRTLVDVILTQNVTEKFSVAVNGDYAIEEGSSSGRGDPKWYGVAAYGAYDHSSNVRSKLRVEWFHDGSGTRTGVDTDLYEATTGLTWTPFPDGGWLSSFTVRPEARCDYSTQPIYDGHHTQFTVAVDLIFKF
jgi:hypothetical protein